MSTASPSAFRRSPVRFGSTPSERTIRDGWDVVRRYADEGNGPWLVDLSHRARWDLQDRNVAEQRPFGLSVPPHPGDVFAGTDVVITRMNRTQVALWHVGSGTAPAAPPAPSYTDTTDGQCMLAFLGESVPMVMEHLTNLDLFNATNAMPHLTQGPVLHVPCQVVTLHRECVLMTFSRGYGQTFADAAIHSATPCGLRPGGEDIFNRWYARWAARMNPSPEPR